MTVLLKVPFYASLFSCLQLSRRSKEARHYGGLSTGLGRIAGVLTLDVEGGFLEEDATEFEPYGNLLAMHIVAAKPLFLSRDHVDPQCLQQERDVLQSQV